MTPWEVVQEALAHQRPKRDQAWLAEKLGVEAQAVTNWKTRGVPTKRYRDIAKLFGLTVDQVEGLEPLPWAKQFEWPFSAQLYERIEGMRSEDLCILEQSIWEKLGEQPPIVVRQQLEQAFANLDKHGVGTTAVDQVTNTRKAKPT